MERIRFGEFELDVRAGELRQGERRVRLQEQPLQILLMLLEHPGQVVTREEICSRLWPNDTIVEFDHSIGTAIKKLRQALGDEAENPRYVETLPRRGFRFIFPEVTVLPQAASRREVKPAEVAASAPPAVMPQSGGDQRRERAAMGQGTRYRAAIVTAFVCVLCGVGLLVWRFHRHGANAGGLNFDQSTLTQVTSSTELDTDPSLSPDASAVAYSSNQNGSFEIYVKSLTPGGRDLQLTSDGQQNYQPAWSPDGKFIAYCSQTRGGIWVVPALGGTAHQVADFGSHPSWSPDGTKIVFQSDPAADLSVVDYPATPPSTLWVVSSSGGNPTQITRPGVPAGGHGAPVWSPDGKRIAFSTTSTGLGEIWSVPATGGLPVRLIANHVLAPAYSPDGRYLYYSPGWTSSFAVMRVPLTADGTVSGPPQRVEDTGQVLDRHLSFSADGKTVAFSAMGAVNNIQSVYISPSTALATGAPFSITRDTSVRKTRPMFSPDGKQLAFALLQVGEDFQLMVSGPDGKDERPVVQTYGIYSGWFPDSQHIAIFERQNGGADLDSVDVASGRTVRLRDASGVGFTSRLSPDGKEFAFGRIQNGVLNVWTEPVEGGRARQLTFDKEAAGFPLWSPDGRFVVYEVKRGGIAQIAMVPSTGGPPVQLTHDDGDSWPFDFSPDGDKVVFAGQRNGIWNIYWISRSTHVEKRITNYTLPNLYVRYPTWSPKGNQVAYEYAESIGNIWLMHLK
ncbi:MAG TPA: winged helix-turn-helix domain-containing protein [Candidatus Aquilonibacter sp.]|nr:winged helix-turn-helix domain-containing protein [Candidatus Aquilonibacter sp.]